MNMYLCIDMNRYAQETKAKGEKKRNRNTDSEEKVNLRGRLYHYLYHELLLPWRSLLIAHNRRHREPRYPGSYVRITKLMGNFALGFVRVVNLRSVCEENSNNGGQSEAANKCLCPACVCGRAGRREDR